MNSPRSRLLITLTLFILLLAPLAFASTPEPPAVPHDYVVDLAGIVPGDAQQRLNAILQELEQKTSAQVLVLTVDTLDGQSIEEFAFNTKEKWKLGQKGKDNGVLIAVAVKDHKYRLEIGYGLEEVLPDSLVGTIGRQYMVPNFRKGDYASGIYGAVFTVVSTIASHDGVQISGMPGVHRTGTDRSKPFGAFQGLVFGFFIIVGLILFITHPQQCFLILLASQMGGRGGWSGGGGGGFGGGGGSFGGGGGGSGGGGGASGGW